MKQLFAIDLHDYDGCTRVFRRPSARAIIVREGRIALVYSTKEKYYKFPGGGIRGDEHKKSALIREVREEVGLTVIPGSIAGFGSVLRRQRSDHSPDTVFEQENFYYVCRVEDTIAEQNLDDYEREAGFVLRYADLDEAIRVNGAFTSPDGFDEIMIRREWRVLQLIRDTMIRQRLLPHAYLMRVFPEGESIYAKEYAAALEELLEKYPGNRLLWELESVSGAQESAAFILGHCDGAMVSPDDFGRTFTRLLRPIYERADVSSFAARMYELWQVFPEGIRNDEPFIRLCFAGDPLASGGGEARTREILERFLTYYD